MLRLSISKLIKQLLVAIAHTRRSFSFSCTKKHLYHSHSIPTNMSREISDKKRPIGLKWRSNTFFILFTVGIGLFTDLFLYGLIVPILPFILSDRLHIPSSQIQSRTSLLLAIYAGASVLFSLPAGIIADRLSARQTPFLAGLLALLGATLMLYLGRSLGVLIAARILQGMSAAVVWTVGLAMVLDTVGSARLGVVIGSIFSFISVGELAAPVLGGVVYDKAGYAGIFGMSFGILGLDFALRLAVVEKKVARKFEDEEEIRERHDAEADQDEEVDIQDETSPLMRSTSSKSSTRWLITPSTSRILQTFPILHILLDSRLLTAEAVAFTQATLLAVFDATIPTEAQSLFSFTALRAGLLFVPLITPYLLLSSLAGKAVDRYGPKPAAVAGFTFLIPVLIALRIPHAGGGAEVAKFCVVTAFAGIGLALISAPSVVEASFVAEMYHVRNEGVFGEQGPYAQLYAVNSMVFSAGLTLGPLVAGALRDSVGFGNMNAVIAGLCAITGCLSFVFLGGRPRVLEKRRLRS